MPEFPRNANAVPSVGCPANGNSSCTVKISHAHAALEFRFRIAGTDESRLREVHLFRDRLHLLFAQSTGVKEHSQRISLQWLGREYIPLRHRQPPRHFAHEYPQTMNGRAPKGCSPPSRDAENDAKIIQTMNGRPLLASRETFDSRRPRFYPERMLSLSTASAMGCCPPAPACG